jgi:hypothetical protein
MFGFGDKIKLVELPSPKMDVGAPMPMVLEGRWCIYLLFYKVSLPDSVSVENNTAENETLVIIKFLRNLIYKFGSPNDEVLHGHPYYPLGLTAYSFFEVKNSDWIKELMKINSVHSYYNKENWKDDKHFILTFKDETFECIADGYEISEENISMKDKAFQIMNEYFSDK